MNYENRDGTGVLFKNDKKQSDKSPDLDGFLIADKDYKAGDKIRLAAWKKEGKKGNFLSLAVRTEQAEGGTGKTKTKKESDGIFD